MHGLFLSDILSLQARGVSIQSCIMDRVGSQSAGPILNGVSWLHVYLAGAAFAVCALIVFGLLLSLGRIKVDYNSGIFTYAKFVYATFLKPHDAGGEGQQHALESFYRTQVRLRKLTGADVLYTNNDVRLLYTMPPVADFSEVVRICWDLWQLS